MLERKYIMAEFASKGVAGSGLGLGIAGTALGLLNNGGIVDENNKVDIDVAKGFINSAFDKSGTVEYLGFKFDKSDGEALINIM